MPTHGLLFDYEYCTNCGSCVASCKVEHNLPNGQNGITMFGDGPWKVDEEYWNYNWYALPTDLCDMCADRTAAGREPICVHHCLANVITYGPIDELAELLKKKGKQMLVVPTYKPRTAYGEFVHKHNKTDDHVAAHLEVSGTGTAEFGAHRHDGRVGEYTSEGATIEDEQA